MVVLYKKLAGEWTIPREPDPSRLHPKGMGGAVHCPEQLYQTCHGGKPRLSLNWRGATSSRSLVPGRRLGSVAVFTSSWGGEGVARHPASLGSVSSSVKWES